MKYRLALVFLLAVLAFSTLVYPIPQLRESPEAKNPVPSENPTPDSVPTADPAAQQPSAATNISTYTRIQLFFAGDVMLDRGVETAIKQHGPDAVFAGIRELAQNADVAFCNLESPLSLAGDLRPKEVNFQAESLLSLTLGAAGFDVVSLANNHISDYGPAGLNETLTALDIAGIGHCGAGNNLAMASRPFIVEKRGVKIAFVAFCKPFWSVDVATSQSAGIAPTDTAVMIESLRVARTQADIVVASFHWDWEYNSRPAEESKAWARLAADHGAHLVIGHHPHVLQGIEFIGTVPAAYSLGNFVFDQKRQQCRETAVLTAELIVQEVDDEKTVQLLQLRVIPILVNAATCFPELPEAAAAAAIAENIATLSRTLGSSAVVAADHTITVRPPS